MRLVQSMCARLPVHGAVRGSTFRVSSSLVTDLSTARRERELYLESVALGDERRKQQEFHNLGWVELHCGDVDAAERMFAERDA